MLFNYSFDDTSFLNSLAIIHEIEEINASKFLPNVSLGYLMCDTCSYASKALQSLGHILGVDASINVTSNDTEFRPSVKIILGAQYSETSVAVARLLNVYMIPLVSYNVFLFYVIFCLRNTLCCFTGYILNQLYKLGALNLCPGL